MWFAIQAIIIIGGIAHYSELIARMLLSFALFVACLALWTPARVLKRQT